MLQPKCVDGRALSNAPYNNSTIAIALGLVYVNTCIMYTFDEHRRSAQKYWCLCVGYILASSSEHDMTGRSAASSVQWTSQTNRQTAKIAEISVLRMLH